MSLALSTGLVTFNNGITSTLGTTTLGTTTATNLTFTSLTNPNSNTVISTGAGAAGSNSFLMNNDAGLPVAYFGIGNAAASGPYRGNFYVQSAGNVVLNPGGVSASKIFDLATTGLTLSTDLKVTGTNLDANQVRFQTNGSGLQWGPAASGRTTTCISTSAASGLPRGTCLDRPTSCT
jgi:hypothetical protein